MVQYFGQVIQWPFWRRTVRYWGKEWKLSDASETRRNYCRDKTWTSGSSNTVSVTLFYSAQPLLFEKNNIKIIYKKRNTILKRE